MSGNPAFRNPAVRTVPEPPDPSQVHATASVTPPDAFPAALKRELDAQIAKNMAAIEELQKAGITFDPARVIHGRIDCLMQAVAQALGPQGQVWELQARLLFEEQMAELIALAQREGRKAQLAQAASFSPGEIRAMARQTGTYGGK